MTDMKRWIGIILMIGTGVSIRKVMVGFMRKVIVLGSVLLACLAVLSGCAGEAEPTPVSTSQPTPTATPNPNVITFTEPAIEVAVRDTLNKPTGEITVEDVLHITALDLRAQRLSDLSSLVHFENLTDLNLSGCQLSDVAIESISSLVNLRVLDLSYNNSVNDISMLAPLTKLETLYIGSTGGATLDDLSSLSGMKNLISLKLEQLEIEDISALSGLVNLTELSLYWNAIEDISPLSGLKKLTDLNLYWNEIEDITPLANLIALRKLNLILNGDIKDISPLKKLRSLEILRLSGIHVNNIDDLKNLTNLRELDFDGETISDISAIKNLYNLKKLSINYTNISDFEPISHLTQLRTLEIDTSDISDIEWIAALANLRELNLCNNKITDISPIEGLTELKHLMLHFNDIDDHSAIYSLPHLQMLSVDEKNIDDIEAFRDSIPSYQRVYIEERTEFDLNSPNSLSRLEEHFHRLGIDTPITSGHVTSDIDGDTLPDIVYFSSKWNEEYNDNLGNMYIALELGNGETVEVMPPYEGNFYADYSNSLFLEDLTGDGIADIIASPEVYGSNYGAEKVYVYTMVNGELELLPADMIMHENPVTTAWGYTPNMNYRDTSSTVGGSLREYDGDTVLVIKYLMGDEPSRSMAWELYLKWYGAAWEVVNVGIGHAWTWEGSMSDVMAKADVGETIEDDSQWYHDMDGDQREDKIRLSYTKQSDGSFLVNVHIHTAKGVIEYTTEEPVLGTMLRNIEVGDFTDDGKATIFIYHVKANSDIYAGHFEVLYVEDGAIKTYPTIFYVDEEIHHISAEDLEGLNDETMWLGAGIPWPDTEPYVELRRYDVALNEWEKVRAWITPRGLSVGSVIGGDGLAMLST